MKNKNIGKLFRESKTSPLLKTPEKDFQRNGHLLVIVQFNSIDIA